MANNLLRVLNFSTHNEDCGIGKYQEGFLYTLQNSNKVKSVFFPTSPNILRIMTSEEKRGVFTELRREIAQYDILHVQHEFSFLHSVDFVTIARIAKEMNKKLVITVHTSPTLAYEKPHLNGFGPRSVLRYARQKKRKFYFDRMFTFAVRLADMVIVHNEATVKALIDLGVERARITSIILPVPKISHSPKSYLITEKLHKQPGDTILAMTGFLHQFKGLDHAVKALTYLPANYKLAIIGGMHMDHDTKIYNNLTDLIRELGLQDRVYITGYIEDDATLNALIRECDICIYPYDKKYYSNISSASLNNGFANHKPVVAYPTDSFIELNKKFDSMVLPSAFAYYELAREIARLDLDMGVKRSKKFAQEHSYEVVTESLIDIYNKL